MPRVTKAMLEETNEFLRRKLSATEAEARFLKEKVSFLMSPYSRTGHEATMTVALEKVTEALAHVITDLKRR